MSNRHTFLENLCQQKNNWNNNPKNVRTSNRNNNDPTNQNNNLGFRIEHFSLSQYLRFGRMVAIMVSTTVHLKSPLIDAC